MKNKLYTTINEFKKSLLNPINEGQFSWFTQDTDEQIGSDTTNTIEVYMYDNKGNKWFEPDYEGYGEFGGKDYYELLAEMNGYTGTQEELRIIGLDIKFKGKPSNTNDYVVYPALVQKANYNIDKHNFTQEAKSDPNQGWQMQDDDDDDYEYDEDMYESKTTLPKVGSIVKINKDVDLISLSKIKNQKLLVIKHKDVGLTETPKFVIVKDKDNKEHSINPKYISIVK